MAKLEAVICVALMALAGCKGKKADTTPKNSGGDGAAKIDNSLCEEDGKRVASYDVNKDGKPDIWRLYKTANGSEYMSCKQVDFDHDGRKDWVVAYDPAGKVLYQKADFDYDGKFDMTAVFDPATGHRIEVQRDSNIDGKFDIMETYDADGQLTAVRHDRNGDNLPDQWDDYIGGVLTGTRYDDDYDGKVDRKEDANGATPAAPTPLTPPAASTGSAGSGSASAPSS